MNKGLEVVIREISIHALREEGDYGSEIKDTVTDEFLSTPSARRATVAFCSSLPVNLHFYPRPPRGGRPVSVPTAAAVIFISIHALREEGDRRPRRSNRPDTHFYPRPPRGGRRFNRRSHIPALLISIHALREEGDHVLPSP